MYLVQVNSVSGLVDLSLDQDGFYAIPEFRALELHTDLGLQKLTVVALIVDYQSPIKYYQEKEKPLKAMDIVFNNRTSIQINSDEIQEALIAYKALQYDLDLEEKKMLDNMRFEKQTEIDRTPELKEKLRLMKELVTIKDAINTFNNQAAGKDLYAASPVRNGYSLSRLEQKLENKNSFYYVEKESPAAESAES